MADDKSKDPTSPASTSYAYDEMTPQWQLVATLMGGTAAMRAAGATYLPQHSEETDQSYQARLLKTTLNNMFEETLHSLTGKPFAEDVKLNDDVPAKLLPMLDNVDMMGNKLSVFARDWFQTGLAKAYCHVLVDMPRVMPNADGSARTVADDVAQDLRPYMVLIRPENVLQINETMIDGKPVITQVRILESVMTQNGFAEVPGVQIKVLGIGTAEVWTPVKTNASSGEIRWAKSDEWATAYTEGIPFVTFYAGTRQSVMCAKPPLLDLAYLNVAHWQSTSEQRHALMTARFPILACEADDDGDSNVTLGPNKVLYGGKYSYVESTGAALGAGQADLDSLEAQMANYGAEFLKDDPGDPTATAKAIDSAESNSSLASIVIRFEDAVAQALSFMARMAGVASDTAQGDYVGGTIELVKAFAPDLADGQGLVAVTAARANKDISREALISVLILRGLLPEDFDPVADKKLLDAANQEAMEQGLAMMNLDPGAPPPAPEPAPLAPQPSPAPKPGAPAPKAPAPKVPA